MAGIFLSYARFDAELGERIIAGLRALDVECWWDRDMPGVDWPRGAGFTSPAAGREGAAQRSFSARLRKASGTERAPFIAADA
jgi:hypothetical protein